MKKLIPYLAYTGICTGVILELVIGSTEAGNIALALSWIVIVLHLAIITLYSSEKIAELSANRTRTEQNIVMLLFAITVAVLFTAGWFVTGAFLLVSVLSVWAKRQVYLEK